MKCHAFVFGLSLFAAKWGWIFCCGESWGRKSLQFHTLPHVPDTRIPRTVARFFHLLSPDTSELNRRIPDNRLLTTATRFFRPLTASEVVLKECLVRKWYSGKHCMEELHRRKSSFAVCEKFTFNNLTQQKPYYFHGIEGSRLDRNSTSGSWRNFASHLITVHRGSILRLLSLVHGIAAFLSSFSAECDAIPPYHIVPSRPPSFVSQLPSSCNTEHRC